MESEYKKVISGVITRTSSIWGLSEETSISLDQGEAMRILPRPDGAAVVQFYLYDRLDDHRDLQNLDIIEVAVLDRQTPERVCHARLNSLTDEFATRRLNMMFRALGYLSSLNQSRAA